MTPNVSLKRNSGQLAPVSSLTELLVFPIPEAQPPQRSLWLRFLNDLSFLLPAFGAALGWLLLRGQSPFIGAALTTICPILLALRIHTALLAWRERKQLAALGHWYRRYRSAQTERHRRAQDEMAAIVYVSAPPARH